MWMVAWWTSDPEVPLEIECVDTPEMNLLVASLMRVRARVEVEYLGENK